MDADLEATRLVDLDALIAHLQSIRDAYGNLPVFQESHECYVNPIYWDDMIPVHRGKFQLHPYAWQNVPAHVKIV